MSDTAILPQLTFRLPGKWKRLDLTTAETLGQTIREYVDERIGTADSETQVRALLRTRLTTTLAAAREAGGVTALLATEIAPGIPMPVMITIYSPRALRMTPAIGTSPHAVASMLREGLTELGIEGIADATELTIADSIVLRIVKNHGVDIHPEAPGQQVTALIADYWYTVPGSKQVVLANFWTPLSDIPNVMLSFFDAAVSASYFVGAEG